MINYNTLLSSSRLRTSSRSGRNILTESESDRGRVLFCPAFRRLQQKAQVFSMEPNAAVRSRLTHSLEVSQIGRFLADEICQRLVANDGNRLDPFQLGSLVNFVETACLMHDIGNPPFGHFGEAAIQDWFMKNGRTCLLSALENKKENETSFHIKDEDLTRALSDFQEFDGNPQGLRIVTRLQWNSDEFGLNLTKTTIASFLKYVRSPIDAPADDGFRKKPGYFTTETDIVKQVWREFGYEAPQRFPLAYIMEAADDIAYCVSDLEDSIEKGLISEKTTFPELEKRYLKEKFSENSPFHKEICETLSAICSRELNGRQFTFTDFRTKINSIVVKHAADQYIINEERIEAGKLSTLLPEDHPPGFILKVLKDFCRENVYIQPSIQRIEMAGYNAISGLLEQFKPLLLASRQRFSASLKGAREDENRQRILLEPKLLALFPEKYIKVYEHHTQQLEDNVKLDIEEWNARAHLIVDFISGMTDDFIMKTYRTLAGMEL